MASKVTKLHTASLNGDKEGVSALIKSGAVIDVVDESDNTPLTYACEKGHAAVVDLLLKAGADPKGMKEQQGYFTPLHLCKTSLECMQLLVAAGADVNAVEKTYKATPLHFAAYMPGDRVDLVKFLVDNGADVMAQNKNKEKPIDRAKMVLPAPGNVKVTKLLKATMDKLGKK